MKSALSKCATANDWDKQLEGVQFSVNNAVQKSIGCTASKLLLGYEQSYLCDSSLKG